MTSERICPDCGSEAVSPHGVCEKCGRLVARAEKKRRFAIGEVIDARYEIVDNLPSGGMGELYKVRHAHLGDFRVLKFLRSDQIADPTLKKRFIQEAKLAASIKHRNVAMMFDFAALPDGSYYMVEEFIDGTSIASYIHRGGRFSAAELLHVAIDVLHGLVVIHGAGIIHRDISPDNLMLTHTAEGDPLVKIIDLGIAKPTEGAGLTTAGFFVGKPHYASPEQMRVMETEHKLDQRSDLYSLGVVLYEMVVGRVPFEAATPLAYLLKQLQEEIRTINTADVAELVPPPVDAFIVKLLRVNREDRYQTAAEALAVAESIAQRLSPAISIAPPQQVESTSEFDIAKTAPQRAIPVITSAPTQRQTPLPVSTSAPTERQTPLPVSTSAPTEPQRTAAQHDVPTQILGRETLEPAATRPGDTAAGVTAAVTAAALTRPGFLGQTIPASSPVVGPYDTLSTRGQTATFDVEALETAAGSAPRESTAIFDVDELQRNEKERTCEVPQPAPDTWLPIREDAPATLIEQATPMSAPSLPTYVEPLGPQTSAALPLVSQQAPARKSSAIVWIVLAVAILAAVVAGGGGLLMLQKFRASRRNADAKPGTALTQPAPPQLPPLTTAAPPSVLQQPYQPPVATQTVATQTVATATTETAAKESRPELRITPKKKPKQAPPVSQPTETVASVETTAPEPQGEPLPKEGELVGAGEDVIAPEIAQRVTPKYPAAAIRMRASGRAVVSVLVGPDGSVRSTRMIKSTGNLFLDDAATAAARSTTFTPATKRGVRVSMYSVLSFDFAMPR